VSKTALHEDSCLSDYPAGIAFSGKGGVLGGGLVPGILEVAASLAVGPFHSAAVWLGVLGASSLAEPFLLRTFVGLIASNCCSRTIHIVSGRQDDRFATAVAGNSKSRFWLVDRNSCPDAGT
jgi:MFS transporter, putative metabolite transport protein